MKGSLEALKRKMSEVLRVFKSELDSKFNRKLNEEIQAVRSSREVSDIMSKDYNR